MPSPAQARDLDVPSRPRLAVTLAASLLGRSTFSLFPLPLLYAVAEATASLAQAGMAMALCGAGASFLAPVRAWFTWTVGERGASSPS